MIIFIISYVNDRKRKDMFYHWIENGTHQFRLNSSYFSFEVNGLYDWMKVNGYRF